MLVKIHEDLCPCGFQTLAATNLSAAKKAISNTNTKLFESFTVDEYIFGYTEEVAMEFNKLKPFGIPAIDTEYGLYLGVSGFPIVETERNSLFANSRASACLHFVFQIAVKQHTKHKFI